MNAKDITQGHFATLELHCDATDAEIQDAYYRLVRAHHPDLNLGDPRAEERFKKVQFAYESLSVRPVVEKPQEAAQFPFIAPDPQRSAVPWFWLTAITAAVAISVTLIGLSPNRIRMATFHPADSAGQAQADQGNQSSVALTEPAQPSTASGAELGGTTVKDKRSTARGSQRDWHGKSETTTRTLQSALNRLSNESTPDLPASIDIDSSEERSTTRAARLGKKQTTPANRDSFVYEAGRFSLHVRPETYRSGSATDFLEPSSAAGFLEPTGSWETVDTSRQRHHQAVGDPMKKANDWMVPNKSELPMAGTPLAHDSSKMNLTYAAPTTAPWEHASTSRNQPLSSLNPFATGRHSLPEVDGWKTLQLTRPLKSSPTLEASSSLENGRLPLNQVKPKGQQDWRSSWDSSPPSNRPAHVDAHPYKPLSGWSTSNGTSLHRSTSTARQPFSLSTTPWAEQTALQSGNAGGTSAYGFSKQTGLEAAEKLTTADRLSNSSFPTDKFQADRWNSYRSVPTPYKSATWTPTANRIDVHKNVLPPYSAKTSSSNSVRPAYQSTLPNIGPAKPQSTTRATAAWQPLGAGR